MKTFSNEDLRKYNPCYDPKKYLEEGRQYSVIDILDHAEITFKDKLWVVLRNDFLSEKLMRLFAVWCARQVQHLMKDERSLNALDVAEKFANGEATKEELAAASGAAWAAGAARDAAYSASDAAYSASDAAMAARTAASDAASDAAGDAARAAAGDAARAAAWAAMAAGAAMAARAATVAATVAAGDAARADQQAKLREMIIAGIETGDTK
jgi:hypothetical protein